MDRSALTEVVADPDRLEKLPRERLPELLADVERLRAEVWSRLSCPPRENGAESEDADRDDQLLDVEAVAEVLDVDERYVYEHADDWPFTRRISPRKLRFSERGLYRWLETRR